jgi:magnesium-transporting ATPase (P-type)
MIRYLDGSTELVNFELECINPPSSKIWNHFSVLTIYFIGFILASGLIGISYALYKKFRSNKGLLKLWFIWLYVISTTQSFGAFIRDIPFYRGTYHALNWLFLPYGAILGIAFLSILILFILNYMNIIRFIKMAPSWNYIETNKLKISFYTLIAFLPAIVGSLIITLLNIHNINNFEILEKLVIVFCVSVPYLHFLKKNKKLLFRRVKNDTTDQPNAFVITLFALTIVGYYIISNIFY